MAALEGESEALGPPLFLPQDVLAEAARAGAHVGKVEEAAAATAGHQRLVVLSRVGEHEVKHFVHVGHLHGSSVEKEAAFEFRVYFWTPGSGTHTLTMS